MLEGYVDNKPDGYSASKHHAVYNDVHGRMLTDDDIGKSFVRRTHMIFWLGNSFDFVPQSLSLEDINAAKVEFRGIQGNDFTYRYSDEQSGTVQKRKAEQFNDGNWVELDTFIATARTIDYKILFRINPDNRCCP